MSESIVILSDSKKLRYDHDTHNAMLVSGEVAISYIREKELKKLFEYLSSLDIFNPTNNLFDIKTNKLLSEKFVDVVDVTFSCEGNIQITMRINVTYQRYKRDAELSNAIYNVMENIFIPKPLKVLSIVPVMEYPFEDN